MNRLRILMKDIRFLISKKLWIFAMLKVIRIYLSFIPKRYKEMIFSFFGLRNIKSLANICGKKVILRFYDLPVFFEIFRDGIYDNFVPKNGEICIDIGANIGLFTLKYEKNFKKIILIEPHPSNFELLRRNILLNNLEDKVEILNVAVLDKIGTIRLYGNFGGASIFENKKNEPYVIVKTVPLLHITQNIKKIDFIKMDVEGSEERILVGFATNLKRVKKLLIEIHKEYVSLLKIKNLLKNNGFETGVVHLDNEKVCLLYGRRHNF